MLGQVQDQDLAPSSIFEAEVRVGDDKEDQYYALIYERFWDTLLPALEKVKLTPIHTNARTETHHLIPAAFGNRSWPSWTKGDLDFFMSNSRVLDIFCYGIKLHPFCCLVESAPTSFLR